VQSLQHYVEPRGETNVSRRIEGSIIVIVVVGAIAAIMTTVTAWGPHKDCAASAFPYIIGCALGSYENLSGGLIAAGGALFAGWLAWSAVKEQIRLEKQKMLEASIVQLQQRADDLSEQLSSTKAAYASGKHLQRLLREDLRDPSPNASKLVELWRRQAFPRTSEGWLSRAIGASLWDAATRVRDMAKEIEQASNMHSSEVRGNYISTREAHAQEVNENFSSVLAQIPARIGMLETLHGDEYKQVMAAQAELRQLQR